MILNDVRDRYDTGLYIFFIEGRHEGEFLW